MNFVIIMVDTQNKSMVGAYGNPKMDTPNLDRLAREGIRFERAYTACPLCTPARASIFSGLYPQISGAYCNNTAPHKPVDLMGTIFRYYGFRAAYTGKWHLDGSAYFGYGIPQGGFEENWWYDGKRYLDDISEDTRNKYGKCQTAKELKEAGFTEENIWGHRVADRAIDFLKKVGQEPFVLVASFDEPHGPRITPPEYWQKFDMNNVPRRSNFQAPIDGKPSLLQTQREQNGEVEWEEFKRDQDLIQFFSCNSYIDREIGRVIDAVDELHGGDTMIIYLSDHGDQLRSHGLKSKGPMMYEESCNIPFIVRYPGGPKNMVSHSLVSSLDIIPTMLDAASIEIPELLNGTSILPALKGPETKVHDHAMISFTRFDVNFEGYGAFYPVRAITDGCYKLVINLLQTDELYDLEEDPYEMKNVIYDRRYAEVRDHLHDRLLEEMDRVQDPFRSPKWGIRDWRIAHEMLYFVPARRSPPRGFPFQPNTSGYEKVRLGKGYLPSYA